MAKKKKKLNKKKFARFLICSFLILFALIVLIFPVFIRLNGEKELHIALGSSYEELGAKTIFKEPVIKGSVDTNKIGKYIIRYSFFTEHIKRTVYVEDLVAPVITLNGPKEIYLVLGTEYYEYGASANDDIDGDLCSLIAIETDLNVNQLGTYHVSYLAKDKSNNLARERRTVKVVEKGPETMDPLEFTLNGFYDDVLCKERSFDEEKFSEIVFVGDSFVGNMGEFGALPWGQIWTRPSLCSTELLDRTLNIYGYFNDSTTFYDAMDLYHPKTIVMLIDSDYTGRWTEEYLYSENDKEFKRIKEKYPDTQLVILSLMPVDEFYDTGEWLAGKGFKRNDRINKMNVKLCELCRKYDFKFINAWESIYDYETGAGKAEYMSADGIHLSVEGSFRAVEYIKTHLDW